MVNHKQPMRDAGWEKVMEETKIDERKKKELEVKMSNSEEWRRDRQEEKILLERSVQNIKERQRVTDYRYSSSNKDSRIQYEPLFFCMHR